MKGFDNMAKKMQNFIEFNSSNEKTKEASRVGERSSPAKKKNQKINKSIKENKKQSSSNKFFITFFLILIILGIGVGCLFSPTFNLTKIVVQNGINITSEEILNSFTAQKGTNVFKVNYNNIEKSVEKLPYIQTVEAKIKFPNEIQIKYVERKPFALVKYLESYLVMDKYGYILEITREKRQENLPIIYNIQFDSYEIGGRLEDTAKTKYDNVVYLLENAKENNFGFSISEINYESIGNVKMWVIEEDIEIIYGEIDRNIIVDKLNYISGILQRVKGKKGTVDISSDNYLEKTVFTERL